MAFTSPLTEAAPEISGLKDTGAFPVSPSTRQAEISSRAIGTVGERGARHIRSTDGGAGWKNVLFINDDRSLGPVSRKTRGSSPCTILASLVLHSGGPEAGLPLDGRRRDLDPISDPALNSRLPPPESSADRPGRQPEQAQRGLCHDRSVIWRSDDGVQLERVSAQPKST
jgi:hypothetical protein